MNADVTSLCVQLSSWDAATRGVAARELAKLGSAAQGAAVALLRAAGDDEEDVCEWVAAALEELGPPAVEDLNALSGLLTASSVDTAYWAATLIGRLGAEAAPAVAALVKSLNESVAATVRQRVAWALGQIGPRAASARAPLEQAVKNGEDPRLAKLAAQALESIAR